LQENLIGALGQFYGSIMPTKTITQLIAELDNQDVARANDQLEKGHGLRVVK
jgi:hypothetical protein